MLETPIAQTDGITMIINDHRIVEMLFDSYERSADPYMRVRLVAKMIEELSVHAVAEEQVLYPVMRRHLEGGDELVEHALAEHGEAKEVLTEIEQMPPASPEFDQKVREMMEEVRHHLEEEEGEHLPKLREAMTSDELTELGRRLRSAKGSAPISPLLEGAVIDLADATRDELYAKAQELDIEGRSDMTKDELARALQQRG